MTAAGAAFVRETEANSGSSAASISRVSHLADGLHARVEEPNLCDLIRESHQHAMGLQETMSATRVTWPSKSVQECRRVRIAFRGDEQRKEVSVIAIEVMKGLGDGRTRRAQYSRERDEREGGKS